MLRRKDGMLFFVVTISFICDFSGENYGSGTGLIQKTGATMNIKREHCDTKVQCYNC